MIPLIRSTQNKQIHSDGKQIKGYPGPEGGKNGDLLFNGYRASVQDDESILRMDGGGGHTTT